MPNYANTQLYELIEHDEEGNAHVYRGHTTQPLHQRLSGHRGHFNYWLKGKKQTYCSSFEVLKHGPARIELVRVVNCANKKEANREEGKFIREDPTCVNILKNYENYAEWYEANKQTILGKKKEYYQTHKETILAKDKEYHLANKETRNAKAKEYYQTNNEILLAKAKEYHLANKETQNAKHKEYYDANNETIKAQKKEYYQANKDTKKAKQAEKVTCECGAVIGHNYITPHRRTWKHTHDFIYL